MRLKYTGGRSHLAISYNRRSYYFTKENNRTLDILEREVINYIFSLPNRAEFEVVMEEPKPIIPEPIIEPKADDKENIKKRGRPKKEKS